jgi:magnesium-transporting ATPase (P-type)
VPTALDKSGAAAEPKPASAQPPDIATVSVPDTLAALQVNPDAGLTHLEIEVRRKEHGYNEVAEIKGHPILRFLKKFWGSRRGCSN